MNGNDCVDNCGKLEDGLSELRLGKSTVTGKHSKSVPVPVPVPVSVDVTHTNGHVVAVSGTNRSSSLPRKAKRVKFFRNGDRYFSGIIVPVAQDRYRSFDKLTEDLTRILMDNVKLPNGVRTIYSSDGKKISHLEELHDGGVYVCGGLNEPFKDLQYSKIEKSRKSVVLNGGCFQSPANSPLTNNGTSAVSVSTTTTTTTATTSNCLAKETHTNQNGLEVAETAVANGMLPVTGSTSNSTAKISRNFVQPKIITLIRNGLKPRKIIRLLISKRNAPTFDHVLNAITETVRLDSGAVRRVYTLAGQPVTLLEHFFQNDDVFFVYGNEKMSADDFELEYEESKSIQKYKKSPIDRKLPNGVKPKMLKKAIGSGAIKKRKANLKNAAANGKQEAGDQCATTAVTVADENISSAESNSSPMSLLLTAEDMNLPATLKSSYSLERVIGEGNFAIVWLCRDNVTGAEFAMKVIDKSRFVSTKNQSIPADNEARIMRKLSHPNIMSLILDYDTPSSIFLIVEYVKGGDLFDAINCVSKFSEAQSALMTLHLLSGIAYLHQRNIVHRDVKPENLLVEKDCNGEIRMLKLCDFGLACECFGQLFTLCGTPTYVAPEILADTGYGFKIDVWAAGVLLYILLCGSPPFYDLDNNQEKLFDAILSGCYDFPEAYWSDVSDEAKDLIMNMIQHSVPLRFSASDVLAHPWIRYWTQPNAQQQNATIGTLVTKVSL